MRSHQTIAVMLGALIAACLLSYFLRPPGPGQVYSFRSNEYGHVEHTAILLRNGDCLVLSRSEVDSGKTVASPGSEDRLFIIAGAERIGSKNDEEGAQLIDTRSGLVARPGDAIDADILFRPYIQGFPDALAVGWALDRSCGHGLAKVFSISRVHQ